MKPAPVLVAVLVLAACGARPVPPTADQVAEVAALASELKASPAKADAVLADHGLDRAKFEALLYEIAADPNKAAAYAQALK